MIHDKAIVETDKIGKNIVIHPYAVIRKDVILGDNVVIHPHVTIESGVKIGNDVEIFPGAYIGKVPKGAGNTLRTPTFEKKIIMIEKNLNALGHTIDSADACYTLSY